jgi:hypothetical protein
MYGGTRRIRRRHLMTRRVPKAPGTNVQQNSASPRPAPIPTGTQQRPSDLKRVLGEPGTSFIGSANQTLGGAAPLALSARLFWRASSAASCSGVTRIRGEWFDHTNSRSPRFHRTALLTPATIADSQYERYPKCAPTPPTPPCTAPRQRLAGEGPTRLRGNPPPNRPGPATPKRIAVKP